LRLSLGASVKSVAKFVFEFLKTVLCVKVEMVVMHLAARIFT